MSERAFPQLRYRDAKAAIEWLQEAFGLELLSAHEGPDGTPAHVEMRWGESVIMFGQESEQGIARFGEFAGRGWMYLSVSDADAHHRRTVAAGAEIVMELTDQDYGSRDYSARDLEGNLWSFGTYDPLG